RDLAGECLRGGYELGDRHHALDQTDPERFRGRHAHAGEDHLERLAAPHQAREPLRAAASGDDGEVDLGQSQLRVLRRDPDVAGQRELAAQALARQIADKAPIALRYAKESVVGGLGPHWPTASGSRTTSPRCSAPPKTASKAPRHSSRSANPSGPAADAVRLASAGVIG